MRRGIERSRLPLEQPGVPIASAGPALRILEVHGDGIDLVKTWGIYGTFADAVDIDAEAASLNGARLFKLGRVPSS